MNLATILGYLGLMLLLGLWRARRAQPAGSFYVAGRTAGAGLVAGSLTATILGASTTLGLAGRAADQGLVAVWWLLAGIGGLLLLSFVFAAPIQRLGVYTLPELLEAQYGPHVRRAASVLVVVAWLGVIAAQLQAAGAILSQAVDWPPAVGAVTVAVALIVYTAAGGQLAVLRTDLWQLVILIVGLVAGLAAALVVAGGWAAVTAALPPELLRFPVNEHLPPGRLASLLLAVGLPFAIGPDMVSRLLCARDEATARRAVLAAAALLLPLAFVVVGLGLVGRTLFPSAAGRGMLLMVVGEALPGWAAGWLAAALLAAVMSSASTCLLTAGTILAVDLRPGAANAGDVSVARSRVAVVVVGLGSLLVALRQPDIIAALLWAYTIYTGGVAVPALLGFWRERLRLTEAGALAAVVLGGGTALAGGLRQADWTLPALGLAVGALLAVSRLTERRRGA